MRRYEALLTIRQFELISLCEERIVTLPLLYKELRALNLDFDMKVVSKESLYASMCVLERRGLVMRNPGHEWPHEWTATDEGLKARDLAEEECLTPS
jgi:hypothetical protein